MTLTDGQRKEIIEALRTKGAIDLDLRQGPFGGVSNFGLEFVMLVVNKDDKMVNDSFRRARSDV